MDTSNNLKKLFYEVYVKLGGTSITVELNDDDYNVAFAEALRVYRARSANAITKGWFAIEAQPEVHEYYLPEEIDNIIELRRFRAGFFTSPAQNFEPFAAAFVQQTLRNNSSTTGNTFPGIIQFDALMQYTELLERVFAANLLYEFDEGSNRLYVWQRLRQKEIIGVHCSALKSIDKLLKGHASYHWLLAYTCAAVKIILGEKYTKTATAPGPQGGIQLKGPQLMSDGKEEKTALIDSLENYSDGGHPAIPIFG